MGTPRHLNGHSLDTSLRVVAYRRVSTGQQVDSGAGLDAQRTAIESEVARRGWNLVAAFEDAGLSGARVDSRPGLLASLALVESGGAEGLVVSKLDRLSRSMADFAALMERSRRHGWVLVALDLGLDTSTPAGEMMANVLATFSQFERRLIGQRTSEALRAKRAQGVKLGGPRVVDDVTVQKMSALRASGASYRQIARSLKEEGCAAPRGGSSWHPDSVRRVLLSRADDTRTATAEG